MATQRTWRPDPDPETHQVSSEAVRRSVALFVSVVVLGSLAILLFQRWGFPALEARMERLLTVDSERGIRELTLIWYGLFGVLALVPLGTAAYVARFARDVFREGRFPPTGATALRSVPVRRGAAARRRGRWLVVYAALLAASAIALLILARSLLEGLLANAGL